MNWPAYSADPRWQERKSKRLRKLLKAYDRTFPKWEAFFESELGLAKDWTKLPGVTGKQDERSVEPALIVATWQAVLVPRRARERPLQPCLPLLWLRGKRCDRVATANRLADMRG
ncbi:MAG: hypothetical protein GY811_22910 [Myxococcales bacterium]|nr:hypothetical protein [Myxococcales bacterium]